MTEDEKVEEEHAQREEEEQEDADEATRGESEDGDGGGSGGTEKQDKKERAKAKVAELEDDPPQEISDWPDDEAKYETFGGAEGDHAYDDGPERNMGPSSTRHHRDGTITVAGEEQDDPEEFKYKPVPGGPTDDGGEMEDKGSDIGGTNHPEYSDKGDDDSDDEGDDSGDESSESSSEEKAEA